MQYKYPFQRTKCGLPSNASSCARGPLGARCGGTGDRMIADSGESYIERCKPVRTLYWWRRIAFIGSAAITAVALGFILSSDATHSLVVPGSLTTAHAQLFARHALDNESRCAACHPADKTDGTAVTQSQLCLTCHAKSMPEAIAKTAHDLPIDILKLITDRIESSSAVATNANGVHSNPTSQFVGMFSKASLTTAECSECHREHQGRQADLQSITSQRCQGCHVQKFQSFASDHPQFRDYPYTTAKRIAFDHRSHRDLHFAKKSATFECKTCHVQPDNRGLVGSINRSVSFETACASCHIEALRSSLHDGLIVFQIPSLDRAQWERNGVSMDSWPVQASQLNDGSLSKSTRILLKSAADSQWLDRLPESGKLNDLEFGKQDHQQTVQQMTREVRSVLLSLADRGQPEFRSRVEQIISARQSDEASIDPSSLTARARWLDAIAQGIPPDIFRIAYLEWFGPQSTLNSQRASSIQSSKLFLATTQTPASSKSSDDDLIGGDGLLGAPSHLSNGEATLEGKSASKEWRELRSWDQLAFGGWMIDSQRMAIVYVPTGHSDPWLARWLELEHIDSNAHVYSNAKLELGFQCQQCHRVEDPIQELRKGINASWRSRNRSVAERPITKFDHTPHMTIASLSDCTICHSLPDARVSANAAGMQLVSNGSLSHLDRWNAIPEFAPMRKESCADCHRAGAAGDSCIQCHNYHVLGPK